VEGGKKVWGKRTKLFNGKGGPWGLRSSITSHTEEGKRFNGSRVGKGNKESNRTIKKWGD